MKLTSKAKHRTPLHTHTHTPLTSLGQFFKEINGSFLLTENSHQVFHPKACIYDEVKTAHGMYLLKTVSTGLSDRSRAFLSAFW